MKKVLVATGQKIIDETIAKFEGYEVVNAVEYKNEVVEACEYFSPDILLLSEGLSGHESLLQIMLQLGMKFPNLRIIYLAGHVDLRDEPKVNALGVLVMAGIYDIIHEKSISVQMLRNILDNPKDAESMSYLTKRVKESTSKANKESLIEIEIPQEKENEEDEDIYKNLHVVSSIKPGTGKSFLSTNVATAIANFGVENKDGKKPRVALIEADLQNLSVGTLLQIEDDKKNLKAVMEKISTIVNENGNFVGTLEQTEEVNTFIKSCFKPFYRVKNLEALVGSQLTFEQIESIKPYYYIYLLDSIAKEYDIVVVDSNSSLTHITTFPLLQMAKSCYYVLNLDFNNVRNNARYKSILKEMGIADKVKYVLNEDIVNDPKESLASGSDIEELIFTADHLDDSDFKLEARVPMLPKTVFLNRLYEGTPVVLDDKKYTLKARYEILKVANQIWPIKNFKEIEEEYLASKDDKKRKGKFFSR
ncbi:ATPase (plasmid) [Aneurinibacillus sp. Ricciae_BoGa-3]|uniref:ATPase n=1 Tax=Aneurinibacillus sp. Ricciae_BoGa-3 TaxID=3022697 RepID=UPI002340A28C|nr:ATPase [Aneurinibacillus sp. Ricciae_BoGa-3]WCK56925.1 ATPase [Aneurinibacillus sp. Ricciae_BoGa-3]WCK57748.1 ATPase [Aneurinibacillus sp. Ricciae_BoGa-3]